LTGLMTLFVIHEECGFTPAQTQKRAFQTVVLGDDTLMITKRHWADKIKNSNIMEQLGITTKPFVRELYASTFCSGYFVPCTMLIDGAYINSYVLTKKIGRVLGKTFWSTKKYGKKKGMAYAKGIAHGLIMDYGHVPFMRAIMESVIKRADGIKAITPDGWYEEFKHVSHSVYTNSRTSEWFYQMYGADQEEMDELEDVVRMFYKGTASRLSHPLLNHIFAIDNGYEVHEMNEELAKLRSTF